MRLIYLLLFITLFVPATAQQYDATRPPNTYRNGDNPYYWKNKLPHPGYWQQDVHYDIKANVDDKTDIITAEMKLTYWNNSPDTLTFVYFHLYQNAFQPNAYFDKLNKANNYIPRYGKYESTGQGTVISKMESGGKVLQLELDNTIMKVYLDKPLLPGSSTEFDVDFKTFFDSGNVRRRMKKFSVQGNKHYDGVHWYPRITVYDRKFKWTTDQHLGKEFYGDFGSFDVELSFPNQYIVEATGVLQNENEMLPPALRQQLDIKNFANKPVGETASIIIAPEGTKKTWRYHAENVHDFSFTADPTYRIGEVVWNGVRCISLAQESNAAGWQNAAEYTAKVIEVLSKRVGMYSWPKVIVADARDGMEYNMITLDGGSDPDYRSLLAHEVAHQWFYGMVGNNETYRASLDEGFAQFIDAYALQEIDGKYMITSQSKSKYVRNNTEPVDASYDEVYYGYLRAAMQQDEMQLNTHSDDFNGALRHGGGYGMVYYKTGTMLYNLQYVLGDELFWAAFQNYFHQWKFAHPYFEDFRSSIIDYTKTDLNWFFDQWLETTKTIDYSIGEIKKVKGAPDMFEIEIERKGSMQMPIDFTVYAKDGTLHSYHIPNTWFEKKTEATILPRWIGWGKLNPEYIATVTIPSGIQKVSIDTTYRLADINMRNNTTRPALELKFDSQISNWPDWKTYEMRGRTDLWWNGYDGLKAGFHFNGDYMRYRDVLKVSAWVNTGLGQMKFEEPVNVNEFDPFSIVVSYRDGLDRYVKDLSFHMSGRMLDGLAGSTIGFEKRIVPLATENKSEYKVWANFKTMFRQNADDLFYLLYPQEWIANQYNNTLNIGIERTYSFKGGNGKLNTELKTSALSADYNYTYASISGLHNVRLGKFDLKTRTFAQAAYGSSFAPESELYIAGANPEAMMDNKFVRSRGMVPDEWVLGYGPETNHFQHGGGLNLRGYAGYLAAEQKDDEIVFAYKGQSGASINIELEFDKFIKFKPAAIRNYIKLDTYVFADAGLININLPEKDPEFTDIRIDAGIGAALTIKRWGVLQQVKPLTLRFDMPFFLNRPPAEENDYLKFRWVVGVNRAF